MSKKQPKKDDFLITVKKDYGNTSIIVDTRVVNEYGWDLARGSMELYVSGTSTCCGFWELGGIHNPSPKDRERVEAHMKEVVEALKKALKRYGYVACYVPNTRHYSLIRTILKELGAVPSVTLKSKHGRGRYTNTRWDYFTPNYNKELHEKALRSIAA